MFARIGKSSLLVIFAFGLLAIVAFYARVPLADWLFAKGVEAKKEWKLKKAISYFTWASRLSDKKDEANFEKALAYQLHGDFLKSQNELEKLLAKSVVNQILKAKILNSNGVNLFNQNKPGKALLNHKESLKISRLTNNRRMEAQSLIGLSRVLYHTQGKFNEAEKHLGRALKIGRKLSDDLIIADALRHLGVVLWWGKGELDRPLKEFYNPALELYRKNGDLRSEATMLSNISLIYSFKGDGFQHMRLQNESLAIRGRIKDQAGLSESYKSLGSIYFAARNFPKAREYLVKSVQLSKKIAFRLAQDEAESYLAGVYVKLGEYDEAIALFRRLSEREKNSPELSKSYLNGIGDSYFFKGDLKKAEETFERLLDIELSKEPKDIRSLSAVYTRLGNIYRN